MGIFRGVGVPRGRGTRPNWTGSKATSKHFRYRKRSLFLGVGGILPEEKEIKKSTRKREGGRRNDTGRQRSGRPPSFEKGEETSVNLKKKNSARLKRISKKHSGSPLGDREQKNGGQ